jgi:cytochrome P450/NADPH-cytochrome P450 reductase
MSQSKKTLIAVQGDRRATVSYYPGTSEAALEKAVRAALGLDAAAPLVLRDEDGDVTALSDALPSGIVLRAGTPQPVPAVPGATPGAAATPPGAQPGAPQGTVPRGPKPYPIVGNLPLVASAENFEELFSRLAREYGSFVRLKFANERYLFVNTDADVVRDMANRPDDFRKTVPPPQTPLGRLRRGVVSNGLFTAGDDEEIWQVAHRILLPAFGTGAIKQYYPRMLEVADELLAHLAALPADEPFLATDLMTRMTFEAISYAGFDTRFHAITAKAPPPFVQAMVDVLEAAMQSSKNMLPDAFHPLMRHKRDHGGRVLEDTVDQIITERRRTLERGGAVPNDILQTMLTARDRVTGQRLPDDNIRAQLITFLVAGHETTSGLLSYALYYLCKNPAVEARLIDEVDRVLGRDYSYRPSYADTERLDYTGRVLKEALRLNPTAPAFAKFVQRDTVVAGMYAVPKGSTIVTSLSGLHRDPRNFGPDPERFEPDHFLPEAVAARHPNAYHPFGLGIRSCIGFQFALVEARMVLARLYQRFRFRFTDPGYKLQHVQTLTMKPRDLYMKLSARAEEKGRLPTAAQAEAERAPVSATGTGRPLLILYGSNMGTCQELAQTLLVQGRAQGFTPTVAELDSHARGLPRDMPVLIVTSTYNGSPPDNAVKFGAFLTSALPPDAMQGVRFSVLGCGNKQWRTTFQKFPRLIEERLVALGGRAFFPTGACDADGDFDAAAEAWCRGVWPALHSELGSQPAAAPDSALEGPARSYAVELVNYAGAAAGALSPSRQPLSAEIRLAEVLRNDELQAADSGRSTRHLEIALPAGVTYAAGDHLGVYPENDPDLVDALAARCGVRVSDVVVLKDLSADAARTAAADPAHGPSDGQRFPCGVPISVHDLLTHHVDLAGPLSRRELRALARECPCPPEREQLLLLAGEERFRSGVFESRLTLLDVLSEFGSLPCDLALLLSLRPALKPRYYSISSSPRRLTDRCAITVGVHAFTGPGGSPREGVCSHYLLRCAPGSRVRVLVKDTKSTFRLPSDPAAPVILIGPGTGLAPLRGFIEERAALRREGVGVGPTLLFFGCRRPDHDYLYRSELEGYAASGDLSALFVAFSREPGRPKVYVQELLRAQGARLYALLQAGAAVYVCGDARSMAPDVQRAFIEIIEQHGGLPLPQAEQYIESLKESGRYLQDVWAAS